MIKARPWNMAITIKGMRNSLLLVILAATLMTGGCQNTPQVTNPQSQPLLTSSIEDFIPVPLARQATSYTCGTAALQSILYYYGDEYREDRLAKRLKSDPDNGTNYRNMVQFAQSKGIEVVVRTNMTIDDLKLALHNRHPVIVAFQAWSDNVSNYTDDWEDGHYAVVIGYDNDRLYFMDPSTLGNYTFISNSDFLKRWHDIDSDNVTRLQDFGLIFSKDKPAYNPNVILQLE